MFGILADSAGQRRLRHYAYGAAIGLVGTWAVAIRFIGVGWGLPYNLHVDEQQGSLHAAARMEYHWLTEGWPRPVLAGYGALPAYVFLGLKNATWGPEIARRAAAGSRDEDAFLRAAYTHDVSDPTRYSWPRLTRMVRLQSAALCSLAWVLVGLIAARLWGKRAALWALVAAGAQPAVVQHAHFGTHDSYLVAGTAMLLHACVRIGQKGRARDFGYAGVALLLMANAKITAISFFVFVPLSVYLFQRRRAGGTPWQAGCRTLRSGGLWMVGGALVAGWLALNPAALRDPHWYVDPEARGSITQLARAYGRGGPLSEWALFYDDKPITYFLTQVFPDALGNVHAAVAVAALLVVAVRERGVARLGAGMAVWALLPFLATQLHTVRYALPAMPALALCVGRLGDWSVAGWIRARSDGAAWPRRWAWGGLGIVVAVGLGQGGWWSTAISNLHTDVENRVAAARWLRAHAGEAEVAIGDHPMYRPPLVDRWGVGREVGVQPVRTREMWSSGRDGVRLGTAEFVAVNEWDLRMPEVPRYARTFPERSRWLASIREYGAPPGYARVAAFARRPSLWGIERDQSSTEIFSFAFDHLPIYIYRRIGPDRGSP